MLEGGAKMLNLKDSSAAPAAARASYACAVATILSLGVGIGIVVAMGVTSGADVARASAEARASALPLLVAAELLKLITGLLIAATVLQSGRVFDSSKLTRAVGLLGAALVFAAGLLGLPAVLSQAGAYLAQPVVLAGLLSLPLTGSWAAMMTSGARPSPLLTGVGFALGILGLLSLALPPAAMLFGLVSILWWVLLGRTLARLSK